MKVSDQKVQTLEEIRNAHNKALEFFKAQNFYDAEQEIINVLKPVLSKPEMKALYVDVEDVLEETLSVIYHLGLIYLKKNDCFNNYSKAAAIFQYCAEFSKTYKISLKLDTDILVDKEYFIKQAHLLEQSFCKNIDASSAFNLTEAIARSYQYKEILNQFRNTIEQKLESIANLNIEEIAARSVEVQNIYSDCTNFFVNHTQLQSNNQSQGLVQKLLKDCFEQLGAVPKDCEYAIVGLGSLSLGTMNPWSDLEFAVLINEDREEYKEYFRNLTKLLWIKVINLQETPLSALGVEALNDYTTGEKKHNWFDDNLTQKAFRFDPVYEDACKSPLGRHGNYKVKAKVKNEETGIEIEELITKPDYELILTPDQMLVFQQEEVTFLKECGNIKNWFEADKHLSQALQTVSLIDGSPKLLKDYRNKLKDWQSKFPALHKDRALQLLNEDISKFSLKLGNNEEGKLLDAKQTIYRLGDRIVLALAGYYSIIEADEEPITTVWHIIDKMKDQGILHEQGAQHLKEAISISTELRIRTYSYNQGRYDNISTYEPVITKHLTEERRKELIERTFHFKEMEILKYFYYVMLRVQELIWDFCKEKYHKNADILLKSDKLFDDNNYVKGMVHARFLKYDRALQYMEAAKEEKPKDLKLLQELFFLYHKAGTIEKDVRIGQEILKLEIIKHENNLIHPDIVLSYRNIGNAYFSKGNYDEAIKYHKQALEINLKVYESIPNHPDIANDYTNLGNAWHIQGFYDKAIKYHKRALAIRRKAYESIPNHPDIAMNYTNLGNACHIKGFYDEAIKYHKQALEITREVHKYNPNHPDIAGNYNNLGEDYRHKGSYDKAIKYHKQALAIRRKAYESIPNHPDIAGDYNNLGEDYKHKGFYDKAIKYHKQALAINLKVYELIDLNHPDVAANYNNLGNDYGDKGVYDKAIKYYEQALKILLKIHESNPNHPDIAGNYDNLGIAYNDKGEYDKAIECHEQALKIRLKVHESNPRHYDVMRSYNNLGSAYNNLGNACLNKSSYDRAISYYKQALKAHECTDHPDIAMSYNNLGVAYDKQGNYNEAINHYDLALKTSLKVYKSNPNHPDIASNYYNLGVAYGKSHNYDEAIKYYNSALEVMLKAYEASPNHPNIASTYTYLGAAYCNQNKYPKAVICLGKAQDIYIKNKSENFTTLMNSQLLTDIWRQYENDITFFIQLGTEYYLEKNYQEAICMFHKALDMSETQNFYPTLFYNLARAYHQNKSFVKAKEFYNKVLILNPQHVKALDYAQQLDIEIILEEALEIFLLDEILGNTLDSF